MRSFIAWKLLSIARWMAPGFFGFLLAKTAVEMGWRASQYSTPRQREFCTALVNDLHQRQREGRNMRTVH